MRRTLGECCQHLNHLYGEWGKWNARSVRNPESASLREKAESARCAYRRAEKTALRRKDYRTVVGPNPSPQPLP